jgi:hypothetical protein
VSFVLPLFGDVSFRLRGKPPHKTECGLSHRNLAEDGRPVQGLTGGLTVELRDLSTYSQARSC